MYRCPNTEVDGNDAADQETQGSPCVGFGVPCCELRFTASAQDGSRARELHMEVEIVQEKKRHNNVNFVRIEGVNNTEGRQVKSAPRCTKLCKQIALGSQPRSLKANSQSLIVVRGVTLKMRYLQAFRRQYLRHLSGGGCVFALFQSLPR
jgi:hypothetical protein